jgi:hypothetical protein
VFHAQATSSPGRRRYRLRWQALAAGVAVAVACAGCGATDPPRPVGRTIGGPIQILVTAKRVDFGDPAGVTSFFKPTTHSVTAMVLLGKLDGPRELVMTWSRMTDHGPQTFFSQHLTVTSYEHAYSTAVARENMSYGVYEVAASVAGATRTVEWGVYQSGHTEVTGLHGPTVPLTAGRAEALPVPALPPAMKRCLGEDAIATMTSPTELNLNVSAVCPESRWNKVTRGTVLASMAKNDGVGVIGTMRMQPGGVISGNFRFNVCNMPAGSDVPGARIGFTTIVYYLGTTRSFTFSTGLPAELLGPGVTISSNVPPGTAVRPGEQIKLKVMASEPRRLGTQSGIRSIRVYGAGRLVSLVRYPKVLRGCSRFRGDRVLTLTYRVPAVAPKVITITALTRDWPGAKASAQISFPVGG